MMKTILLTALFALCIATAGATEIQGKGKYRGKELTTDGFDVKCGWQPWMTCWEISTGGGIDPVLKLGNGDIIPLLVAVNPDNGWDPFNLSTSSTSIDIGSLTVRPMVQQPSDDPEDAGCSTCTQYIYHFQTP